MNPDSFPSKPISTWAPIRSQKSSFNKFSRDLGITNALKVFLKNLIYIYLYIFVCQLSIFFLASVCATERYRPEKAALCSRHKVETPLWYWKAQAFSISPPPDAENTRRGKYQYFFSYILCRVLNMSWCRRASVQEILCNICVRVTPEDVSSPGSVDTLLHRPKGQIFTESWNNFPHIIALHCKHCL